MHTYVDSLRSYWVMSADHLHASICLCVFVNLIVECRSIVLNFVGTFSAVLVAC